ncbi:MAG: YfcE family phosphodiesterase [Treponema sp.]|nr:YfcE family phosphodiesterase [Treponema sp.]MCL2266682.1 YfcE family phosphodiesterase [Treponema sp.]
MTENKSKKILVFSDSHGSVSALKNVFAWAKDHLPPDDSICAAACLGDGLSDISKAADETGFYSDWKIVRGNNDFNIHEPEAAVFDFAGNCFFMCHGHRHGLYGGIFSLLSAAKNNKANTALFGHTHVPFKKNVDGVLLVNPGSVSRPRSGMGSTFAVIECAEGSQPDVVFYGIGDRGSIYKVKVHN